MDYNRTVKYVNSFIDFEKISQYSYASSFRPERMHAFLQELGNPHKALKVIHVAGSKGKGSTCAIIASILKEAGYAVGLYTSPHLLDARERIRVLNKDSRLKAQGLRDFEGLIKKQEFIELIERIKPVAEKFRDHKELGKLSFFEVLTACAFLYFKGKEVDFAVLETGLGGRLDATNVTEPMVCGITNISLEHTDKLGDSLELITKEKAGIVKCQGTVSASQQKIAMDVIRNICQEKKSRLYEIDKDITYNIIESSKDRQVFDLEGPDYSYKNLELNLMGSHQAENASLAVAIVSTLSSHCRGALRLPCSEKKEGEDKEISEEHIRTGLKNIYWPGRLQILQKDPYVILDGAQNVASIKAVLSSIKQVFSYKRLICMFGVSSDKDIKGMSIELDKAADIIILTKSSSERAKNPIDLKENFRNSDIKLTDNAGEALEMSMEIANKEDLILVIGSLYLVGAALKYTF